MDTRRLDGRVVSEALKVDVASSVSALVAKGTVPTLGVVLVGADPASVSYITAKERTCEELGMRSVDHRLPLDSSTHQVARLVKKLAEDPDIHGILVQLPLPSHIDTRTVLSGIPPSKDVDGFLPESLGNLLSGGGGFVPCTPAGVLAMLDYYGIPLEGRHAVVVGRSLTVGKPLALLLLDRHCTVTICHSRTSDLGALTRMADLLVAAVGRPGLITGKMLSDGAVVVDVGVNRVEDRSKPKGFRLVGDVVFEEAEGKASWISPVPGGVGPMTIAMLMVNTLLAAERAHSTKEKKTV